MIPREKIFWRLLEKKHNDDHLNCEYMNPIYNYAFL